MHFAKKELSFSLFENVFKVESMFYLNTILFIFTCTATFIQGSELDVTLTHFEHTKNQIITSINAIINEPQLNSRQGKRRDVVNTLTGFVGQMGVVLEERARLKIQLASANERLQEAIEERDARPTLQQLQDMQEQRDARPTLQQLQDMQEQRDARPTLQQLQDMQEQRDARPTLQQLQDMQEQRDARPTLQQLQDMQAQLLAANEQRNASLQQFNKMQAELLAVITERDAAQQQLNKIQEKLLAANPQRDASLQQFNEMQAKRDARTTQQQLQNRQAQLAAANARPAPLATSIIPKRIGAIDNE